jgi:RNA polymerase sigma-70 factor, ECF subfamily
MASSKPVPERDDDSITGLLAQLQQGNREAEARLLPRIYDELHRLAGIHMRHERAGHTLQPTALVNEAYLRLQKQPLPWQSRAHFFAVGSRVMRQILVDHARAARTQKRGADAFHIVLDYEIAASEPPLFDALELNELLEKLEQLDPKLSTLMELYYFGGLTFEEIGHVMNISSRTARRWWERARAWLRTRCGK